MTWPPWPRVCSTSWWGGTKRNALRPARAFPGFYPHWRLNMPRSRRKIDRDNRAIERCKTVIQNAIKDYKGQWVAAPIAQRIQGNVRWSEKIETDKPLLRYL